MKRPRPPSIAAWQFQLETPESPQTPARQAAGNLRSSFGGNMKQPLFATWRITFYIFVIALIAFATNAHAQTFRGGINGTVTDVTGAAIPNASITALNVDTANTKTTITSSAGDFLFQDLPLGNYTVTASFTGFSTVKT